MTTTTAPGLVDATVEDDRESAGFCKGGKPRRPEVAAGSAPIVWIMVDTRKVAIFGKLGTSGVSVPTLHSNPSGQAVHSVGRMDYRRLQTVRTRSACKTLVPGLRHIRPNLRLSDGLLMGSSSAAWFWSLEPVSRPRKEGALPRPQLQNVLAFRYRRNTILRGSGLGKIEQQIVNF